MNPTLQALAQTETTRLLGEIDDAYVVQVATVDGFDIAQAQVRDLAGPRLAAMSSTLAAIGHEFGREAGLGRCRSVVIDAEDGHAVVCTVPRHDGDLVLTVLTRRGAMLGMVLLRVADGAKRLAAADEQR